MFYERVRNDLLEHLCSETDQKTVVLGIATVATARTSRCWDMKTVGWKSIFAHHVEFFEEKWKREKLYESKGIKPKLCSYRPVGGKSTLAHLFVFC